MPSPSSSLETADDTPPSAFGGTRAQAIHRLQVGASLLVGILIIVGLANVIEDRAEQSAEAVVPEAAATVALEPEPASAADPLADAGVVPDLPDEPSVRPSATATGRPADLDATR